MKISRRLISPEIFLGAGSAAQAAHGAAPDPRQGSGPIAALRSSWARLGSPGAQLQRVTLIEKSIY